MTEFEPRTSGIGATALPTEPQPVPPSKLLPKHGNNYNFHVWFVQIIVSTASMVIENKMLFFAQSKKFFST